MPRTWCGNNGTAGANIGQQRLTLRSAGGPTAHSSKSNLRSVVCVIVSLDCLDWHVLQILFHNVLRIILLLPRRHTDALHEIKSNTHWWHTLYEIAAIVLHASTIHIVCCCKMSFCLFRKNSNHFVSSKTEVVNRVKGNDQFIVCTFV